jgi:hypothetical protein
MTAHKRLLIASVIRQKPAVLNLFLTHFGRLILPAGWQADWLIQANGNVPLSDSLLVAFIEKQEGTLWRRDNDQPYSANGTHDWNLLLISRVAAYKDEILDYAQAQGYDAVFFVDSDLLVHPRTLIHLEGAKGTIVSEIFWTRWETDQIEMPNVWLQDQYAMVPWSAFMDEEARDAKQDHVLNQLRLPGVYEVGGLGGCTWLGRDAIEAGNRFKPVANLSLIGEDRHFCVRAAALGFGLFVDTHVPAFHIYRASDLPKANKVSASLLAQSLKPS